MINGAVEENENNQHIKNSILSNLTFKQAYRVYFYFTPYIEINHGEEIRSYYIKLNPICFHLPKDIRTVFQDNLDRTNSKSKINMLFEELEFFKSAMAYNKRMHHLFTNYKILDLICNSLDYYRNLSSLS